MNWNATMPIWVGVVFIVVPLVLLVLAFALLIVNKERTIEALETRIESKQETIDALIVERDGARTTIAARDLEIERLNKPDLTTLPLQEAVKPERRPIRRNMGKKAGAQ